MGAREYPKNNEHTFSKNVLLLLFCCSVPVLLLYFIILFHFSPRPALVGTDGGTLESIVATGQSRRYRLWAFGQHARAKAIKQANKLYMNVPSTTRTHSGRFFQKFLTKYDST